MSVHQPHYLPWLRYFAKIAASDVFVLLDDVQYEKNGFQNRNKIKTAQGWTYLTVPIRRPTQRPIREIEIDNREDWRGRHRRALELSYRRAPYFECYWPGLESLLAREWESLAALNGAMLELFMAQLGISTRLVRSSDLGVPGQATARLAGLCRALDSSVYLSGSYAAQAYLDPAVLAAAGVRLALQDWTAPAYSQLYPAAGFIPDLAIVDLLFNEGPAAPGILASASRRSGAPAP